MSAKLMYYAQLGFGLLCLSGFICVAVYVVRRKLELDRQAARALSSMLPKWLSRRASSLKGELRNGVLFLRRDAYAASIEAVDRTPEARLRIAVSPAQPFAEQARIRPGDGTIPYGFGALASKGTLRVSMSPAGLHVLYAVAEPTWEATARALDEAVKRSLELAESAPRGGAVAEAACPVCARPIDAEPRACARCGKAHHPDCWAYSDGCANVWCRGADMKAL